MSDLVKLTVNVTERAHRSLEEVAGATGDTRTDSVGRALVLYSAIIHAAAHGGGELVLDVRPGKRARILVGPEMVKREIAPSTNV